ncbi:MAG TPA: sugar phosphate nucleotidyltransferase [Candidatus Eisenbacteria bacterium]|nr:sugar phosphate nucleotidyltransferase [Candidatus Eisenbacteria bacterium]
MKVVLFCGGLGLRLRDVSEDIPKPMMRVGHRPILWHVMKYYAHFGHRDFILCLGYKSEVVKDYFLHYSEAVSNDFVLSGGGRELRLLNKDIEDWNITFLDTGYESSIGERLLAAREHLAGDEMFLANYSDGVSDLPLPGIIERFRGGNSVAAFLCVRPRLSYHVVTLGEGDRVETVLPAAECGPLINGGYFVFRNTIFDYLNEGEDIVTDAFPRLIRKNLLLGYRHEGFWASMDTFKDKQALDKMIARGDAPWEIWKKRRPR